MNTITVGSILARMSRSMVEDIVVVLALVVLLGGLGTVGDLLQVNTNAPINIATVVAQYYVLRRLCERNGLMSEAGPGKFWPYFGLGILSGLGIVLGFVLLIIPGLLLAARWSAAGCLLIGQGRGVTDAMGESWRLTKPGMVPIALSIVLLSLPGLLGFGTLFLFSDAAGNSSPIATLAMNLLLFVSLVAGWYQGFAVYSLVVDKAPALGEIFA